MPQPALQVRGLVKSFADREVVHNVSFNVENGTCVGLLGPNGAGKSTILSIIAGLLHPDAGTVLVHGETLTGDLNPSKRLLGLVPQELALYDELTARANLELFGALYGLRKGDLQQAIDAALKTAGLSERANDRVQTFSGGMKRRLNLTSSLLHQPRILLLDEPTVGVDPQSRNALFDIVEGLVRSGTTVVYTTHYMEEVERLCERVVIIDQGKVMADGRVSDLKSRGRSQKRVVLEFHLPLIPELQSELLQLQPRSQLRIEGQRLTLDTQDLEAATIAALNLAQAHGNRCRSIHSEEPDLEHIFLELTGSNLRDA